MIARQSEKKKKLYYKIVKFFDQWYSLDFRFQKKKKIGEDKKFKQKNLSRREFEKKSFLDDLEQCVHIDKDSKYLNVQIV